MAVQLWIVCLVLSTVVVLRNWILYPGLKGRNIPFLIGWGLAVAAIFLR